MRRLFSLVRVGLKSNFGLSLIFHRLFREKKDLWLVPVVAIAVAGLLPALYGYLILIRSLYRLLQPLGQAHVLLTFALLAGQLLILIFGLYYVISAFYFSRDLEILIPLPLKPFEVMLSKFIVILVNEYLTVFVVIVPVFLSFGILAKAGPGYWVNGLLVYFLLPVIPLAIVSLLVVAMMRLVNLSRKKDALIIVGSLILITGALGLQYSIGRMQGAQPSNEAVVQFLTAPDGLVNKVGAGFPPSVWATKALSRGFSGGGMAHLLLFAGVSVLLFGGMVVSAERLFYRGLIGIGEVSGRRRILSRSEISRRVSSGLHPVRAILRREWWIMNRTPIFLLNGTLTVVLIPVIFILMARMDRAAHGGGDMLFLFQALGSVKPSIVIPAAAAFLLLCGCLNGTSSSTFSREGSQFWLSKVIPVRPSDQVVAKFIHSYLIALLGLAAGAFVLAGVLRLRSSLLLGALGLALIGAVGLTAVGMTIDLARPLLGWTNPQKAIKQNLNVLFAFFADLGIMAALGFAVRFLVRAGVSASAVMFLLFAAVTLISASTFLFLLRFAERRYAAIEV